MAATHAPTAEPRSAPRPNRADRADRDCTARRLSSANADRAPTGSARRAASRGSGARCARAPAAVGACRRRAPAGPRAGSRVIVSAAVSRRNAAGAGEHLVEHAAEREDVGAVSDRLAAHLLRRHVADRAEHVPGVGGAAVGGRVGCCAGAAAPVSCARPKSRIFTRPSLRDEDVLGLEVAVHDALVVRRRETARDLDARLDAPCARGSAPPGEPRRAASRPRAAPSPRTACRPRVPTS